MHSVAELIRDVEIGDAQTYRNLTVIPLRLRNPVVNNALITYEEAGEFVDIQEMADAEVNSLMAINRGALPVLIPEGSIVCGNKQDRVVIHTVVLNNHPMVIETRCGERNRWRESNAKAIKSKFHAYSSLRKKMYMLNANQGEIWKDVDAKGRKMKSRSVTGTVQAIYKDYAKELDDYTKAFSMGADVNGGMVLIDKAVVGVELFPVRGIFRRLFTSLISSYSLDAIDNEKPEHVLNENEFLNQLGTLSQSADVDIITMKSEAIEGKGYLHEDSIIHLAAFAI